MVAQYQRWSTLLHFASFDGDFNPAQLLIANGADAAAPSQSRWAPLHLRPVMVILMLQGSSPSMVPTWQPRTSTGRLRSITHPQRAISTLHSFLVEHGLNTAAQNQGGWTPLHFASRLPYQARHRRGARTSSSGLRFLRHLEKVISILQGSSLSMVPTWQLSAQDQCASRFSCLRNEHHRLRDVPVRPPACQA